MQEDAASTIVVFWIMVPFLIALYETKKLLCNRDGRQSLRNEPAIRKGILQDNSNLPNM